MTVRELINQLIDVEDKDVEVKIAADVLIEQLAVGGLKSDRWSCTLEVDIETADLQLDYLGLEEKS